MSKYLRSRMLGCLLTMAVAVVAFAPAANAAQTDPVIQAPVADGTYLALGDSLAFGYQAVEGARPACHRLHDAGHAFSTPATSTTTPRPSVSRA